MKLTLDTSVPLTSTEKLILITLLGKEPPVEATSPASPAPAEKAPTVEDVAKLMTEVLGVNGGREKAKQVLTGLGVTKVRELTDEQAPQALAELKALLP